MPRNNRPWSWYEHCHRLVITTDTLILFIRFITISILHICHDFVPSVLSPETDIDSISVKRSYCNISREALKLKNLSFRITNFSICYIGYVIIVSYTYFKKCIKKRSGRMFFIRIHRGLICALWPCKMGRLVQTFGSYRKNLRNLVAVSGTVSKLYTLGVTTDLMWS